MPCPLTLLPHRLFLLAAGACVNARYLVVGPSEPGFLSRLVEPVAKLGEVPTRVHASRRVG